MNQNFTNLNVANTLTATNANITSLSVDNIAVEGDLNINNMTIYGTMNSISVENFNALDTTSSITSQFIDAKNYTDNQISLLLNNPDADINSIRELFEILGEDPNLNVVNSLANKISKTDANQTISALNMNFTNPLIASDFTIKNTDNSTKSVKNSISSNETNITTLTNSKLDKTGGIGTDNELISPLIRQHLYISNSGGIPISTTKHTTSQGVIAGNLSSGQKEINFVNSDSSLYGNSNNKAFCFHKFMSDGSTLDDFFTIFNNGRAELKGDLSTNGISISSLNSSLGNLNNVLKVANSNLGIGTTNPVAKLHVVGDSILNGNTTITQNLNSGSISTGSNITCGNDLVSMGLIYGNVLQCNSGSLLSINRDIPNPITYIKGRVGIGLSNPVAGSALHVIGDTTISGSMNATGNINASTFTINGLVNVGDTLNNNIQLINTLESTRIKAFGKLRLQVFPSVVVTVTQVGLASYAVDFGNGTLYFNLNPMTVNGIVLCQIVETPISEATYGGWITTATGSFSYGGNTYTHRITSWIPPANQVFTSTVAQKQIQNFDFSVI